MAIVGVGGGELPVQQGGGGPLKRYDVVVNGVATTLQLSDADAKARGLFQQPAADAAEPVESKSRAAANKSRTAANKSAAAEKRAAVVSQSMNARSRKGDGA